MKRDTEKLDYREIGLQIVEHAKRINHERHLAGEFDPAWSDCVKEAQDIVIEQLRKRHENGNPGKP